VPWLAGAVLAALAVRATLLWLRGDYLDYDEAMYLLLARSLLENGAPLLNGLPHTALGPLVPAATAGLASLLGLELLTAQRILSALAGALLLVPVWSLLRSSAGPRVARLAVTLLVAWPALIDVAPKFGPMWSHMYAGSEPTHLLFLFSALAVGEAALRRRGVAALLLAAAAGGLLALAFMARGEAVVFGAIYAIVRGVQSLRHRETLRHASAVAGLAVVGLLVVAAPQLSYLHRVTGKWIVSGQTAVMGPTAETLQEGFRDERHLVNYVYTWYRLHDAHTHLINPYWGTPDDVDRDVQVQQFAVVAAAGTPISRSWIQRIVNRLLNFAYMLWTLCTPLFLPLVLIGLITARGREVPVFAVAGLATGLIVGFYLAILPRFFLFLVPALALWAAYGVDSLVNLFGSRRAVATRLAVSLLIAASLTTVGYRSVGDYAIRLKLAAEADRRVAEDLAAALPEVDRFMHWHPRIAYWAGWDWRPLPAASLDAIAHYCARIGVGHVLLASVGHDPLGIKVPYLVITIDEELEDTLRAIPVERGRPHEHPQMYLGRTKSIAGYPTASLGLRGEG
jgi:4-amino-4-deoxy-L-arabinose transferase-like glycosyltransferase